LPPTSVPSTSVPGELEERDEEDDIAPQR
jgi:hypothetical protein